MYQVRVSNETSPLYFLTDDQARSEVQIVPERGGLVTQWRLQGQPIFYFDQERFKDPTLSVRGGIPVLFPICGNLPDNQYTVDDQAFSLKQHGFARDLPWEVMSQSTDQGACLDFKLSSNSATLKQFPFPFELVFRYQLQGQTLSLHQRIVNLGERPMPFSLGLHPYFFCRDKTAVSLEIPAAAYLDQMTGKKHPYQAPLDLTQPELDLAFTAITAAETKLVDHDRNLAIELTFSDLYKTLVVWTVAGKDYVCLEPWSAPRNALSSGEQLTRVDPFSFLEAWVKFTVSLG